MSTDAPERTEKRMMRPSGHIEGSNLQPALEVSSLGSLPCARRIEIQPHRREKAGDVLIEWLIFYKSNKPPPKVSALQLPFVERNSVIYQSAKNQQDRVFHSPANVNA